MTERDDRRNLEAPRVTMSTLVDVCLTDGTVSPFQGETANVSGRGMHVRTSYLPNIGQGLVCRFDHAGQEVLVEGRVAWRSEGEDSGEFGIQFTALDASSVELLKALGQPAKKSGSPKLFSLETEDDGEREERLEKGNKVKLHIDGLPAPMKAKVMDGSTRKVKVGSSLEFLKMGRPLEIEALGSGDKLGALVDSVNVVVNPATRVPELVVMLRYEGVSPTPPPAKVTSSSFDLHDDEEDSLEDESNEEALGALHPAAEALSEKAKAAFEHVSSSASESLAKVGSLFQAAQAGAKSFMAERREKKQSAPRTSLPPSIRSAEMPRRRTTSVPTTVRRSLSDAGIVTNRAKEVPSIRPKVSSVPPTEVAATPSTVRRWVILGSAFTLLLGGALLTRGMADKTASAGPALSAEAAKPLVPPVAPPPAHVETNLQVATSSAPPTPTPAPVSPDGIVADVPLFGPRPMTTAEAVAKSPADDAAAEKLAAEELSEKEALGDEPKEVKPWGKGRMVEPLVHRIRLDGSGGAIEGTATKNGFSITIPGRKALESGRNIEKRDRRITLIKASNTARGAQFQFEFKGPVPGYRVRLKGDTIEFLLSASEVGVATR